MEVYQKPPSSFPPAFMLREIISDCEKSDIISIGFRISVTKPDLYSRFESFFNLCIYDANLSKFREDIPYVYYESDLIEKCCPYYTYFVPYLPRKFKTFRLYQALIKARNCYGLETFPWTVLSRDMQSVVSLLPYNGNLLPRRSSRYVRFIVINELCKFIENQFLISNLIFKRFFGKLEEKRRYVGMRGFNTILSFLGTTQTDTTFTYMANAFRVPRKKYKLILYNSNGIRLPGALKGFLLSKLKRFLFSKLHPVQKYAKLITDLESSTDYYSSVKDNGFIRRMIEERKKQGSFIFDFR